MNKEKQGRTPTTIEGKLETHFRQRGVKIVREKPSKSLKGVRAILRCSIPGKDRKWLTAELRKLGIESRKKTTARGYFVEQKSPKPTPGRAPNPFVFRLYVHKAANK